MQIKVLALALLLSRCWCNVSPQESLATNEIFLTRFKEPCYAYRSYWVESSLITSKASWSPAEEQFPAHLSLQADRAKDYVLSKEPHLLDRLHLGDIEIYRIPFPMLNRIRARNAADLANLWAIAFSFNVHSNTFCRRSVLMLLDGTFATEKTNTPAHSRSPLSVGDGNRAVKGIQTSNESTISKIQREVANEQVNSKDVFHAPDFNVASVQWNPALEAFPLELSEQAIRLKSYLIKDCGITNSLTLSAVGIHRFLPAEALRATNAQISNHEFHWYVVFRYNWHVPVSMDDIEYSVYILLDGSVAYAVSQSLRGIKAELPLPAAIPSDIK